MAAALALSAALVAAAWAEEAREDGDKKPSGGAEYVDPAPDREDPEPPIARAEPPPPDSVKGALALSSGDRVEGFVHLTRDKTLSIFDPAQKKIVEVRLAELTHVEQKVVDEHMEKEWRWKENASDEKVYTGREYPVRELTTTLHFRDGRELTGPVSALIYVKNDNGDRRFLLVKKQKGEPGQTLAQLLYVALVDFREPGKKPADEPSKPPDKAPDAK